MQSFTRASALKLTTSFLALGALLSADIAVAQDNPDEIIVTARKRAETVQEVPVSVSVLTAAQIENLALNDISDISKTTAGLLFDNEFGRNSNRPVIRGQANILGDSGVAYFIDGVYISNSIADYGLNNIERIEVVKGPQSALYGRNTYSGAINIITKSPNGESGGNVMADISENDRYEVSGSVFGSLNENISARVSARHYEFGGEFENQFDGSKLGQERSSSIAGSIHAEVEKLTADFNAYYGISRDSQPALFHSDASENNCFFDDGALYGGGGRYFCGVIEPRSASVDISRQVPDAGLDIDTLNLSARFAYDLGGGFAVTSITGYNSRDETFKQDADYQPTSFQTANFTPGGFPFTGFPFPPFGFGYATSTVDFTFEGEEEVTDFSQELRFNYDDEKLHLILGGYYFNQQDEGRDIRDVPGNGPADAAASFAAVLAGERAGCAANPICSFIVPFGSPATPNSRNQSVVDIQNVAIFGAVTYDFTDAFSVSAEGRYAEESLSQRALTFNEGGAIPAPITADAKFTSFDPRVTIDWQVSDNNLLYGVFATGQKPGGFNGATAILAGLPSFDEETVQSFEIGSKNRFFGGQVTANLAGYFNEIDGYQLTQNARVEGTGNTTSATVNAGDAEVKGFELELTARPDALQGLTLTANYAYTDAEFTEGLDENQGVLNDVADDRLVNGSAGCQILADPTDPTSECLQNAFGSIAGNQIPRTAEHQLFADIDYRHDLSSWEGWAFNIGANYSFESSKFAQVHNLAETGTTNLVNARIGVSNDAIAFQIYGRNLLDEDSTPLVLRYADGADSFKRSFVGTLRRGTHFGARVDVKF